MTKLFRAWLAILTLGFAFPTASVLLSEASAQDLASNPKYVEDLPDDKLDKLMKRIALGEGNEFRDDEVEHFVATLRREYPFESIRARLPKFIDEGRRPPIQLNSDTKEDLLEYEAVNYRGARTYGDDVRPQSLRFLHDEEVRAFVARDGNGRGRTPPPSAIHLSLKLGPSIQFDKGPTLVSIEQGGKKVELLESEPGINEILLSEGEKAFDYSKSAAAYRRWAKKHNPTMMPTERHLRYLHQGSHDSFLNATLSGFVRSVAQVAGFLPHQLTHRPVVESWDDRVAASFDPGYEGDGTDPWTEAPADATWLLTQLELVSLLLQETPMVYESDHLPRMDQLSLASTRSLDSFETNSLVQLYNGEHFLVDARLNEIRMFGAIRAAKSCLACHNVRHQELLGAFTYTLTRAKPIAIQADKPRDNTQANKD